MPENPEPGDRLVALDNALDEHQRVRRNFDDSAELRRAQDELEDAIEKVSDTPARERDRDD
jgi:hypothetical protein